MKNQEIWKDIEGYEGIYQVSSMGRIRALDRIKPNSFGQIAKGHIMAFCDNGNGYVWVSLWKNGKGRMRYVHRLVANAFLKNDKKLPQVNHKNEDKKDNRVENLEYCDAKYNCNYGNRKINAKNAFVKNGTNRAIDIYDINGNFIKTCQLSNDACVEFGVNRRGMYLMCNGITKSSKGYRFAFHGEKLRPYSIKKRGILKKVIKYDCDGNMVATYKSMREAEKANELYRGFLRINNIKSNGIVYRGGFKYVIM